MYTNSNFDISYCTLTSSFKITEDINFLEASLYDFYEEPEKR